MRFTNSHIIGQASNDPNELTTAALAIEIVSPFGGRRFILSITHVVALKSYQKWFPITISLISITIKDGGYNVKSMDAAIIT